MTMAPILCLFAACVAATIGLAAQSADAPKAVRDPYLNTGAETYAVSFRDNGTALEAWVTVAAASVDDMTPRQLATSTATAGGFGTPVMIDIPAVNDPGASYNGVPAFNPCNPDEGILVSNRLAGHTGRRSNDLYHLRRTGSGWTATRLPFNSNGWDDTPAFGPGGSVVYFASDRRAPGSGRSDIYMVRRNGDGWTAPRLLDGMCEGGTNETSPFATADGRLLYASDRSGDFDIWEVDLDPTSGLPASAPRPCSVPDVNLVGSDELHPVMTPGGSWLLFSSNRHEAAETAAYHLYHRRVRTDTVMVDLQVTARTRIKDATKRQFFGDLDSIYGVRTTIAVDGIGSAATMTTSLQGMASLVWTSALQPGPFADRAVHTWLVRATPHLPSFIAGTDTLVLHLASCRGRFSHTIYLDDTTSQRRRCEFTFRTFNVPFFVTAYWCPTTRRFRSYTPCASLFTDDVACERLIQPTHCETNEAYQYTFEPARLVRTPRGAENCVAYGEFNRFGDTWAQEVDASIETMRDEVRAALGEFCVQEAVRQGHVVQLTYVGTTDDRAIDPKCRYTGPSYKDIQALAPDITIDTAIVPFMTTGRAFNRGGYGGRAGGNQLLSDLRSLYVAILFDNLCRETIPLYAQWRASGMLRVASRGQAIDTRDIPYAFKRAAGVELRVPGFDIDRGVAAMIPNRRVELCSAPSPCR